MQGSSAAGPACQARLLIRTHPRARTHLLWCSKSDCARVEQYSWDVLIVVVDDGVCWILGYPDPHTTFPAPSLSGSLSH